MKIISLNVSDTSCARLWGDTPNLWSPALSVTCHTSNKHNINHPSATQHVDDLQATSANCEADVNWLEVAKQQTTWLTASSFHLASASSK
jgi:hypothetical protein